MQRPLLVVIAVLSVLAVVLTGIALWRYQSYHTVSEAVVADVDVPLPEAEQAQCKTLCEESCAGIEEECLAECIDLCQAHY